jgi:chromosome segregation protein
VRKRLRPLALQASAAERAERLAVEIARLRARLAQLDLAVIAERRTGFEERKQAVALARRDLDAKLEALLEERNESRTSSPTQRASASRRPRRSTGCEARASVSRCGARRPRECSRACGTSSSVRGAWLDARVRAEREALAERVRLLEERLTALERSLVEREGLPPAARALAEQGERLALSLLDVEPGMERAVTAALRQRASALVAENARSAFALLERARAAGLGSLTVLVDPTLPELPVVSKEDLLASVVPAVTPEGFGYDPQRGELWFAGETAEAVLLELEARRRALAGELDELRARASAPIPAEAYSLDPDPRIARLAAVAERLVAALAVGRRALGGAASRACRLGRGEVRAAGRRPPSARRRRGRSTPRTGRACAERERGRHRARAPRRRGGRGPAPLRGGSCRTRRR